MCIVYHVPVMKKSCFTSIRTAGNRRFAPKGGRQKFGVPPFIETTKNSPFTTTENLLRSAYGSQGINHEKKQIPLVLGQPLAVVV